MSYKSSSFLGHISNEILVPTCKGILLGLQSYLSNLFKIVPTYLLCDNQSFLFTKSLLIFIPSIYLLAPKSFASNAPESWAFSSLTIALELLIRSISSTCKTMIIIWSSIHLMYTQWSSSLLTKPNFMTNESIFSYKIWGDHFKT